MDGVGMLVLIEAEIVDEAERDPTEVYAGSTAHTMLLVHDAC